jgi:hypothetical protein
MGLWVLLLTLAILIPASPASADSEEPWVFEGGGWGHGVGMSQFGALGQAEEGRSYVDILQYYYTGTSVADMPGDHWTRQENGLWVGLVPNTDTVTLEAVGGPVTICQPADTCPPPPPYNTEEFTDVTVDPDEVWKFEASDDATECRFRKLGEESGHLKYRQCDALLSKADSTNVRFKIDGTEYARGEIRLTAAPEGFHVVVTLPMEEYLYGLAEVPNDWHAEALKAQAVAGRGYALATAQARGGADGSVRWAECGCHIRDTVADQAYAGWSKEVTGSPNLGERWTQAVDHTDREILTHPQSTGYLDIATTYYSSSNGGHSEDNEYGFGGTPRPWLRSVEDPWSADPQVNPLATWSVRVEDAAMASYLGWDRALDAFVVDGPPGVLVEFTGWNNGGPVSATLNGPQLATLVKSIGFGYFAPGSPNSSAIRVSPYFRSVTDPPGFDDIIGNTFELDIEWLGDREITKGCNPPDNTEFCPDDPVTRGQMAAFLKRYLDLPAASGDRFNDDNGTTFEDDINRLAEAGITKGCNPPANDQFCPNDPVSREQMAAFIVRALNLTANDHAGFTDVSSSNTFIQDIGKLATAGITKGCNPPDNTRYCAEEDVTRGQMAAFLHRADQQR